MALIVFKNINQLCSNLILSPERYDKRRELFSEIAEEDGKYEKLGNLVRIVSKIVNPLSSKDKKCLVVDTGNAQEGKIVIRKLPILLDQIGSSKKVIYPGNVIISRLRPYLRQVAYVDSEIPSIEPSTILLCSTEFFVLQSLDDSSIAYLVPFLLSEKVQSILAASQEGGHHPRFNDSVLLELPVPILQSNEKQMISRTVEESIHIFREAEKTLDLQIQKIESSFELISM